MRGERVADIQAVWSGQPGSYVPLLAEDGSVASLWFKLPTGSVGRIAAIGHGTPGSDGDPEPEWTITVEDDGSVTVDPSIKQHAVDHPTDPVPYWHGHLRAGVWT